MKEATSRRLSGILAAIGTTGPVAYLALITALGSTWDVYDPIGDSMSELGAVDSPVGVLTNVVGFMGLGVTILAFAAAYRLRFRGGLATVGVVLLCVAGVFMVAVGFFPCDPGCVDVTRTGELHSMTSMPQAIALPAAAMLSAAVFRSDPAFGPRWQTLSFWIGLASLATGAIVGAGIGESVVGLVQRVGIGLSLAWVTAVSYRLWGLADSDG